MFFKKTGEMSWHCGYIVRQENATLGGREC
jgi:hypothetical protein